MLEQQQLPTVDQVFKCPVGDISFMPPQNFHQLLGSEICASWVFRVLLLNQRKLLLGLKKKKKNQPLLVSKKCSYTRNFVLFVPVSSLKIQKYQLFFVQLVFYLLKEKNGTRPLLLAQFSFCMLCSTASVLNSFRLKIVFKTVLHDPNAVITTRRLTQWGFCNICVEFSWREGHAPLLPVQPALYMCALIDAARVF